MIFKKFSHQYSFLILATLFLIVRFLLILWAGDHVSHYEGLQQGYIAMEILSGARAPWTSYQVDTYTTGTLWMGLLAVPFLALLGPSLFTLKMLALSLSFGTFAALYFMLKKFISVEVARLCSLLWIFSAPLLSYMSLMALGSHERLLPAIGILFFTLSTKLHPQKKLTWAGLGLAYGFAVSTSYLNLILIFCSLTHIRLNKHYEFKHGCVFVLGLFTGLAPWLAYNISNEWAGVDFFTSFGITETPTHILETLRFFLIECKRFIVDYLPNSIGFSASHIISANLINLTIFSLIFFLIATDWTFDITRTVSRPPAEKMLVQMTRTYFVVFLIFHIFSKYKCYDLEPGPFHFRYYIPFYALALIYISLILKRIPHKKIFTAFLIGLCTLGHAQTLWGNPFGKVFDASGYKTGLRYYLWHHPSTLDFESLEDFDQQIEQNIAKAPKNRPSDFFSKAANQHVFWNLGTPEQISSSILKIPHNHLRRYFFRRWPAHLETEYTPQGFSEILKIGDFIPHPYNRDFYFGLGKQMNFAEWPDASLIPALIDSAQVPYKEFFYLTWGASLFRLTRNGYANEQHFVKQMKTIRTLSEKKQSWVYRGFGTSIYRSFQPQKTIALHMSFLRKYVGHAHEKEYYWGIGWYLAKRYYFNDQLALKRLTKLKSEQCHQAIQGFKEFYRDDARLIRLANNLSCKAS